MLKAIGKAINIRVSGYEASKIPIIVLGNTPISKNYINKVDNLKRAGIIQGFWSINPKPSDDDEEDLKATEYEGFKRFDSIQELYASLEEIFIDEMTFFSGMKTKRELGRIIEIASREPTYEEKAERFLQLMRA